MKFSRKVIVILAVVFIAVVFFWTSSRYPDLNAKAHMAESGTVQDSLSVWPLINVDSNDAIYLKILYSTINWIANNLKGMLFGVFLGGCFFSLLPLLSFTPTKDRFKNTLFGIALGTPLGVCVNCAAPVFKGVLQSKRLELAFAMMLSSPTLNIVVLTMVFSLFPLHIALLKLFYTLLIIVVIMPLLSKVLDKRLDVEALQAVEAKFSAVNPLGVCQLPVQESWFEAIRSGLMAIFLGVKYVAVRTVPLMLVAGLLGAALSHLIPFSLFVERPSFFSILLVSLVGVLLPVPVAFDVILSNALYVQGLPINVVTMLLCSLGIFSLYSFFIVWNSVNKLWALALLWVCFIMTVGVGLGSESYHYQLFVERNIDQYKEYNELFDTGKSSLVKRHKDANFSPGVTLLINEEQTILMTNALTVKARNFLSKQGESQLQDKINTPFEFIEGTQKGLVRGFRYGVRDYSDPFWIGRGTGAGDINQDGWIDIVLGSHHGPQIYFNKGGWFERIAYKNPFWSDMDTYVVALIDLNNDGWQDLFFSTYDQGNYVVLNRQGQLLVSSPVTVPNNNALLTIAPSFADIDGNGFIDIINGNMALGIVTGFYHLSGHRSNSIVFNNNLDFFDKGLSGWSGETMSSLVADINGDHIEDVYFSNDFLVPDRLLLGNGRGYKEIEKYERVIERTPTFSMSVDVGDVNNDLQADVLVMGTLQKQAFVGEGIIDGLSPEQYSKGTWSVQACDQIQDEVYAENCRINRKSTHLFDFKKQRNFKVINCNKMPSAVLRQDCLISTMWFLITNNIDLFDCEADFAYDHKLLRVCEILGDRGRLYKREDVMGALNQDNDNLLLLGDGQGKFVDINQGSVEGVHQPFRHPGGWTWNGKFMDLDNDGWQDVFNAEGAIRERDYGWNVFMHNQQGRSFRMKSFSWGLTYAFGLFSFVSVDYDNDGDLDIIGNSAEGPVHFYENKIGQQNQSIRFELVDKVGNSAGIGSKIVIKVLGENQETTRQMRIIKASGGYQSFDPPVAWFGLGRAQWIDEVVITWPEGQRTVISKKLRAGKSYRIFRTSGID